MDSAEIAKKLAAMKLAAEIDGLFAAQQAAHLEVLKEIAVADRAEHWRGRGANSMAEWLANRYGTSLDAAEKWVADARALSIDRAGNGRGIYPECRIGIPYQIADCPQRISRTEVPSVDPRVIARGVQAHADTQNTFAGFLRSRDIEPRSPSPRDPEFDLAWHREGVLFVAEVKSLTEENETRQLRLGLGQVLDYAVLLTTTDELVVPVIALEREPSENRWHVLCNRLGVLLIWPGTYERVLTSGTPESESTLRVPLAEPGELFGPAKVPRPVSA